MTTVQPERQHSIPDRAAGALEGKAHEIASRQWDKIPGSSYEEELKTAIAKVSTEAYQREVWESQIRQAFEYAGLSAQDQQQLIDDGRDINAAAARIIAAMELDRPPEEVREMILRPLLAKVALGTRDPAWDARSGHQKSIPRIRPRRNRQDDSEPTLF